MLPPREGRSATSLGKTAGKPATSPANLSGKMAEALPGFFCFVRQEALLRRGRKIATSAKPLGFRWVLSASSNARSLWYSQVST
jgi:hypothetical protein